MKRIKALNGYTIYQITERDAKQNPSKNVGEYEIYFSSDIRDYGINNSIPEYDGITTLQSACDFIPCKAVTIRENEYNETTANNNTIIIGGVLAITID